MVESAKLDGRGEASGGNLLQLHADGHLIQRPTPKQESGAYDPLAATCIASFSHGFQLLSDHGCLDR